VLRIRDPGEEENAAEKWTLLPSRPLLERYDAREGRWRRLPDIPNARSRVVAITVTADQRALLALGGSGDGLFGWADEDDGQVVRIYDIAAGRWRPPKTMKAPFTEFECSTAVSPDGRAYAIARGRSVITVFDPLNTEVTRLIVPRGEMSTRYRHRGALTVI
jgi:hypothetical protein